MGRTQCVAATVAAAFVAFGVSTAAAAPQASVRSHQAAAAKRAHMAPNSPMGRCMDAGGPLLECWYWATFLR